MEKFTFSRLKLKEEILSQVWEKYKGSYSMRELAKTLGIPLTTFFRCVKAGSQKKVEEKERK
jgi:transposase-like protein